MLQIQASSTLYCVTRMHTLYVHNIFKISMKKNSFCYPIINDIYIVQPNDLSMYCFSGCKNANKARF